MEKNIEPALALIVGILILIQPALLNVIVAVYLIVIGVLGLARNLRR
jgi:threonine/homoserine efflux transporter RhtA